MLMFSFEHSDRNKHNLEASQQECIIQLAFFFNLSLALMKNKLATLLGCLPEIIVTSRAFSSSVICFFVDKHCGER